MSPQKCAKTKEHVLWEKKVIHSLKNLTLISWLHKM